MNKVMIKMVENPAKSNDPIYISVVPETRYTAGYRAYGVQMRNNTQMRLKRKEEALERVKRAFKRSLACIASIAFGVLTMVAFEGDASFMVFALIVGVFFLCDKEAIK